MIEVHFFADQTISIDIYECTHSTYLHTHIVRKGRIVWHNHILKLCITYAEKTAEHTFYMHIVVNYIHVYHFWVLCNWGWFCCYWIEKSRVFFLCTAYIVYRILKKKQISIRGLQKIVPPPPQAPPTKESTCINGT